MDPDLVQSILTALHSPKPVYDLFSRPHNALFPPPPHPDAFSNSWSHLLPVWANPPFDQLGAVLKHIEQNGAHMVLVVPAWRKHLPMFWRMSLRQFQLPYAPTFRKQGNALLPPPNWHTWALYIWYCPRTGSRGPEPPPLPSLTFLPPRDSSPSLSNASRLPSTLLPIRQKPTITYFRKSTTTPEPTIPPKKPSITLAPPTTTPSPIYLLPQAPP